MERTMKKLYHRIAIYLPWWMCRLLCPIFGHEEVKWGVCCDGKRIMSGMFCWYCNKGTTTNG